MRVLVIDNYDSFTYNLVHSIKKVTRAVTVWRNDEFALDDVATFDKIVLSPGPGIPQEANLLLPVIDKFAPSKSILGVCLGLQAITESFGGKLVNTKEVYHGVASTINVNNSDVLFRGLQKQIEVGRYHSWVAAKENFPDVLNITATGPKNEIMALRHKDFDVCAVQFHPESILTPDGDTMIKNWLTL